MHLRLLREGRSAKVKNELMKGVGLRLCFLLLLLFFLQGFLMEKRERIVLTRQIFWGD